MAYQVSMFRERHDKIRESSKYSGLICIPGSTRVMLITFILVSTIFSPCALANEDHAPTNPHYEMSLLKNKCEYLANTIIIELDDHRWKKAFNKARKIYRTARHLKRIDQYE